MLTRAHEELWAAARDDLRLRVGEGRFEFWLAPLKVVSEEGSEVLLGVPNRVVQDWVEKQYLSAIREVLSQKRGSTVEVRLLIDAELFREHRKQCADVLGARPQPVGSPTPTGASGIPCAPLSAAPLPKGGLPPAGPAASALSPSALSPSVIPPEGDHLLPVERESGDSDRLHPLREQTLENFVVGASNQLAYSAVLQILESPGSLYNPLFVHGPSGVGKTHLLKGICRSFRHRRVAPRESSGHGRHPTYARAAYVTGEQFFHHYSSSVQDGTSRKFRERFRSLDVLVVDDVQLLINKKKTQLEFLQTFNALVDAGRQIVVASDVPPKTLKDLEPGLVGRFLSGLVVAIKRPDYATRLGIVRAQASRMPSRIDDRVLQYLAENVRGDARELVSALMQLDIRAQLGGGSLGFEESKEILGDFVREQKKKIDLRKICDACASHFALPVETLTSRNRQRHVSLARQVAMFLARRFTDKSLAEIGKYFGNRNHTTVKCAEVKIARLLDGAGGGLSREVRAIVESLEE